MNSNTAPLPHGWIQQADPQSGHVFYVDTKAEPPRSIWTHPYEDEVYLREHPDARNKVRGSNSFGSDASLPLPPPEMPRRHSYNGRDRASVDVPPPKHKEGFFKKMKKKAVNSMEQHNERKRQQQQQQQMLMQQQLYNNQSADGPQYGAPQYAYPQGYGGMGSGLRRNRRGGMGGGMALPLLGGMAGGLLLGDVIGNDINNGGGGWDGNGGGGGWDGNGGGGGWDGGGDMGGGFGF